MEALFISIEGGDGTGKSTQARRLRRRLAGLGYPVTLLAEPGGTTLGRRLRRILKFSDAAIAPETEALLFAASRAQLVREQLLPTLARGDIVLCDRYADSTLAYQGYGRGLAIAELHRLNQLATGGLKPRLTVLLDLPVELGNPRLQGRVRDRFESEGSHEGEPGVEFRTRVREGYLTLAGEEPERWAVVDAALPRGEVAAAIWQRVKPLVERTRF